MNIPFVSGTLRQIFSGVLRLIDQPLLSVQILFIRSCPSLRTYANPILSKPVECAVLMVLLRTLLTILYPPKADL
jgi:hypothetical protein